MCQHELPSAALAAHRDEVIAILDQVGAENIRVFGSIARGEDRPDSDIDLLYDYRKGSQGIFALAGAWRELERVLGFEVDVVPAAGLKPRSAQRILLDARPL